MFLFNKKVNMVRLSVISVLTGTFVYSHAIWAQQLNSAQTPSISMTQQSVQPINLLSFEQAIKQARKNDTWLTGNRFKQQALEDLSVAASSLPDPKMSITLANLPTDGFAFDQEGMTQFKVGVTQMIPRGDTLTLKREQLKTQSAALPWQRKNRQAQVTVTVGQLWLDAYRVQQSIALIEKDRSLFLQLADVAQASYSSAVGKTRQQDIIRAQLELTRLDERLDKLEQQQQHYQGLLSTWLLSESRDQFSEQALNISLENRLPSIELLAKESVLSTHNDINQLVAIFSKHPAVLALNKKIAATKTGINIAKQKYQPQWAVNGSYGYRADAPNGNSRADLLSIGVSFDLPLFTENRQDKEVSAAVSKTEAVKTEKTLLIKQFLGRFQSAKGRLSRLAQRQKLYQQSLLPQMHEQAEASLNAYTNDDGDFAEVVRARIAVLNAEIEQLNLNVTEQKINLTLNYLFAGTQVSASAE